MKNNGTTWCRFADDLDPEACEFADHHRLLEILRPGRTIARSRAGESPLARFRRWIKGRTERTSGRRVLI
jgi:hypothetical protein